MVSSSFTRTTMREASTESTAPPRLATTVTPESIATGRSMPVPTSGVSERSVGTAWRCMFEPMSARLASSCSRNGISEAATDTICFGRDVHVVDALARHQRELVLEAAGHQLVGELALGTEHRVRLRDRELALLDRRQVVDLVGDAAVRPRAGTASRGSRSCWCAHTPTAS